MRRINYKGLVVWADLRGADDFYTFLDEHYDLLQDQEAIDDLAEETILDLVDDLKEREKEELIKDMTHRRLNSCIADGTIFTNLKWKQNGNGDMVLVYEKGEVINVTDK